MIFCSAGLGSPKPTFSSPEATRSVLPLPAWEGGDLAGRRVTASAALQPDAPWLGGDQAGVSFPPPFLPSPRCARARQPRPCKPAAVSGGRASDLGLGKPGDPFFQEAPPTTAPRHPTPPFLKRRHVRLGLSGRRVPDVHLQRGLDPPGLQPHQRQRRARRPSPFSPRRPSPGAPRLCAFGLQRELLIFFFFFARRERAAKRRPDPAAGGGASPKSRR